MKADLFLTDPGILCAEKRLGNRKIGTGDLKQTP